MILEMLLNKLKEPTQKCLLCNEVIKKKFLYEYFIIGQRVCGDCYFTMSPIEKRFVINGIKCFALYSYSSAVRNAILQIKVGGDIDLAHHILDPFKHDLKLLYHNYIIVFAPSSEESNKKRGFNHLQEIFGTLDIVIEDIFTKNKPYKQSDQKYSDRKNISTVIGLKSPINPNKKYLIVDDVTTSYETLKACINLLLEKKVKHIKCFVIAYNHREKLT